MIQFDEHIFQMGWFNHQLGLVRDILANDWNRPLYPSRPFEYSGVLNVTHLKVKPLAGDLSFA